MSREICSASARRPPFRAPLLGILALAAAGVAGSACKSGGATAAKTEAPRRHDGETLFRGIYLGEGPVATLLPHRDLEHAQSPARLRRLASEVRARGGSPALEQSLNEMAAGGIWAKVRAAATDDFFHRFAERMQSGDHVQVRAAYTEGRQLLDMVVAEQRSQLDAKLNTVALPAVIDFVIRFINVKLWIDVFNPLQAEPVGATGGLAFDLQIDDLTMRLAGAHRGA